MTTATVTSFAAGIAAAALAFGLLLFGNATAATCALGAIAVLGLAPVALRTAALASGGAVGLGLALLVMPGSGVDGIVTLAIAAGVVATCGALRAPTTTGTASGSPTPGALRAFAATFAAGAVVTLAIAPALRIGGADARSFVHATTPLLAAIALGAAITRFLAVRHELAARIAPPFAAIASATSIALALPDFETTLATANAIQAPSASRLAWLYGISLQVTVTHGIVAFTLGALAERAVAESESGRARVAIGIGLASGAFTAIHTSYGYALAAAFALLAATAPRLGFALRSTFAATALALAGWLAATDTRAAKPPFSLDDPVALFAGDESTTKPATSPNGRPLLPRDPPGWPFQSDALAALLDLARQRDPVGPIALVGREAPTLAGSRSDSEIVVATRAHLPADPRFVAVVVLPSVFAERLTYLTRFDEWMSETSSNLAAAGAIYVACDLAEVSLDTVGCIVGSVLRAGASARVLAHGRHAIVVASKSAPTAENDLALAASARAPRPVLVLGAADAAEFARDAARRLPRHEPLMLGDGRSRLPHGMPRLAAKNLRALLRLTRLTVAGRSEETRVRLELAAAILDDDFVEEDRLLRLLATFEPEDATRLRIQRERARERIVRFLIERREFENPAGKYPNADDADLRFRLGRVFRGAGNPLAAIEEFTRVVELRPHLLEGSVALAETFLEADARGLARIHRGQRLDSRKVPFDVQPFLLGLDDAELLARIEVARGQAQLRTALEREGDDRRELLMQALGRFEDAHRRDPANAGATRLAGETLFRLGYRADAVVAARRSIAAAPLDPRGHDLLARITADEDERRRARAAALRLAQ